MYFLCPKEDKRKSALLKVFFNYRPHVKRAVALFAFLVRLYNLKNEDYEGVKRKLEENGTSLQELHDTFAKEFELAFCKK